MYEYMANGSLKDHLHGTLVSLMHSYFLSFPAFTSKSIEMFHF